METVQRAYYGVAAEAHHFLNVIQDVDLGMHPSALLLILVIISVATMAILANMETTSDLLKGKANIAIGTGLTPKHNDGAPPLPEPTEIVSLRIYPIKSCRGIEINSTRLHRSGLLLDRNWMFIDRATRQFMTIRGNSDMTLVNTEILQDNGSDTKKPKTDTQLRISIHGRDKSVSVPAFPTPDWLAKHTTLSTVEIWERETDAYEYGPEINGIFSEFFGKDVALVYKGPTARHTAVNGSPELYGEAVPHHFADVMSLQVASEASMADLNRRLEARQKELREQRAAEGKTTDTEADDERFTALTIERFRPNIVVRGGRAWEEDSWKRIRISTTLPDEEALYRLDLDVVAHCARCQVPNVDPATAAKHPRQPWDTLMKFRRVDTGSVAKYKPCFGMLCIPRNEGKIAVGALVECLETTDKHLYNTVKFADL